MAGFDEFLHLLVYVEAGVLLLYTVQGVGHQVHALDLFYRLGEYSHYIVLLGAVFQFLLVKSTQLFLRAFRVSLPSRKPLPF